MRPLLFPNLFLPLLALLLLLGRPGGAAPSSAWDSRTGSAVNDKALLDRLSQADVVFLGEQHDDRATHALELAFLQGLQRRAGARLSLAMEMFERDVQPALNGYLRGKTDEATFLESARPWSNYGTDYRPLIEYSRAHAIPVVASNAPQPLVSRVGREGLSALKDAPTWQVAVQVQAPHDAYWERFRQTMAAMGSTHGGMAMDDAAVARFYDAQAVRDETMAESVARLLDQVTGAQVLHVNGQFHSDFGEGIPQRLLWRRPLTRVSVVSIIPVKRLPKVLAPGDRARGDFVVYVLVQ